jgi:RNA-directed DNA polymerase
VKQSFTVENNQDNRQRLFLKNSMKENNLIELKIKYQKIFRELLHGKSVKQVMPESFKSSECFALLLLSIDRPSDLCSFFGMHYLELESIMNNPYYITYRLKKNKTGFREINAPIGRLKVIQKKLNRHLQGVYMHLKPSCATGFVLHLPGSKLKANIVENALPHIGKKYVLNMDIKDFFSSISDKRIYMIFREVPFCFDIQIATALTYLVTKNDCLPQGAPSSPILSNFACLQLDEKLTHFANKNSWNYTRYADDLTFSSNEPFTLTQIDLIKKLLVLEGFEPNEKKFRVRSSNKKQLVTGLVVNEKVNVDRKMLKKTRAMLYDLRVNGASKATQNHFKTEYTPKLTEKLKFLQKLKGTINFIGQVRGKEDPTFLKMQQDFAKCFNRYKEELNTY